MKNECGEIVTWLPIGTTIRFSSLFANQIDVIRQIRSDGMYFTTSDSPEPFWYQWSDITEVISYDA